MQGQLTARGIVIGIVGCVVITASSVYIALKMGALPWPIVFAAIVSLFFLKALGKTSLNEANVTHTIMSAGSMVAGGLAFTIPGIWMLGHADDVAWWQMLVIALAGVALGLVCTGTLHRRFVAEGELEYPIGEAAAQTLKAGDAGGSTGKKLFGAMGFAAVYTLLRDTFGAIPAMLLGNVGIPGVAFGIYNSPMLLAVGFLVGTGAVVVWIVGAVIGNFGIVFGGSTLGLWSVEGGQGITSSLGMGVMMGSGIAVILKDIIPLALRNVAKRRATCSAPEGGERRVPQDDDAGALVDRAARALHIPVSAAVVVLVAVALVLCLLLGFGPLPSIVVVLLVFVTTAMSAQSVGQTGIDPMEIFGLIVLLIVAAFGQVPQVQLFFVAAVVAVACGLAGDVMNDFHAGKVLGTDPRAQWVGQAIGGVVGAVVAVVVMLVLVSAYGPGSFGPQGDFIAAQASVVATMVSGIPSLWGFVIGLVAGCALYFASVPSMMLGLGIYLPFYMSFSAFLGAMVKVVYDQVSKRRGRMGTVEQRGRHRETGLIVASGLLGGESIIGIVTAIVMAVGALTG